jgi:hypothetical protein
MFQLLLMHRTQLVHIPAGGDRTGGVAWVLLADVTTPPAWRLDAVAARVDGAGACLPVRVEGAIGLIGSCLTVADRIMVVAEGVFRELGGVGGVMTTTDVCICVVSVRRSVAALLRCQCTPSRRTHMGGYALSLSHRSCIICVHLFFMVVVFCPQ